MIHAPGGLREPAARLLERVRRDGVVPESPTLAIGLAPGFGPADVAAEAARLGAERLVVLGLLGTHRDARVPALRALWDLEEAARGAGRPALALRFGPLVGPDSPLWRRLAARPRLRKPHRLVCPVAEEDAVATLARALTDPARRSGWYEVAGDPIRLDELAALAARTSPAAAPGGEWEPPLEVLETQRLADPSPWIEDFGVAQGSIAERARGWAA